MRRLTVELDSGSNEPLLAIEGELERCPHDTNLLLLTFYGSVHAGQNDRAIAAYKKISALDEPIADVDADAGYIFSEAGEYLLSIESFTRAISQQDSVDLRFERAKSFNSLGERRKAISDLEAAMATIRRHDPHEIPGVVMAGDNAYFDGVATLLADLYVQEQRYVDAIVMLQEMLEKDPENTEIKDRIEALKSDRIEIDE